MSSPWARAPMRADRPSLLPPTMAFPVAPQRLSNARPSASEWPYPYVHPNVAPVTQQLYLVPVRPAPRPPAYPSFVIPPPLIGTTAPASAPRRSIAGVVAFVTVAVLVVAAMVTALILARGTQRSADAPAVTGPTAAAAAPAPGPVRPYPTLAGPAGAGSTAPTATGTTTPTEPSTPHSDPSATPSATPTNASPAGARQVADDFVDGLNGRDLAAVRALVCQEVRPRVTEQIYRRVVAGSMVVESFDSTETSGEFRARYRVPGTQNTRTEAFDLIIEDGGWRVCG